MALRELRANALSVPAGGQRAAMREAWLTLTAQPECHLCYRTSAQGYLEEQRLRNRLERVYESPTPLGAGPAEPPDVDVRRALGFSP